MHHAFDRVPNTTEDWILPTFTMSTYDGDVVSWRALIPHSFIAGVESSIFSANQFYVYQTMMQLPSHWNMTYDGDSGIVSVFIQGLASVCGSPFEEVTGEDVGIVFEDDADMGGNATDGNASRLRG
jgi:hypothetical protein